MSRNPTESVVMATKCYLRQALRSWIRATKRTHSGLATVATGFMCASISGFEAICELLKFCLVLILDLYICEERDMAPLDSRG